MMWLPALHQPWHIPPTVLESIAQGVWFYVVPPTLTLAAIILGVRLIAGKKYTQRMSRATFFLILSFAVLMDRLALRLSTRLGDAPAGYPDAMWATFYTACAVYFAYALIREWAFPFVWWTYRRIRHGDTQEPLPEEFKGVTDA
jgi:hypothetical protein